MKPNRSSKFPSAFLLLGAVCAFASVAQAATDTVAKADRKTKAPKVTTETRYLGPATEQVVVTEKYKDGTVIRVVQIIHGDGTSETSGERHVTVAKS